jgi:hypothetical protein
MNQALTNARRVVATTARRTVGPEVTANAGSLLHDAYRLAEYLGSPAGRESASRLRAMKNRYWGERAFIIGNGPSLRGMDLEPLADQYTFGSNRIYLAFDDLGFHTTFLSAIAEQIVAQFGDEMAQTACQVFLSHRYARLRNDLPRTVTTFAARRGAGFGYDPIRWGFFEGATVTYFSMQLAFYLGFTEVILIGVDHSFVETGEVAAERLPKAKDDLSPDMVVSAGDDPNHFTPNYFGKGVKWKLPDWVQMEIGYRRARAEYERAGRVIVDATVGGKLMVFPKVDYVRALSERPLRLQHEH